MGASSYSWNFGDGTGVLVTQGSLTPVYHTYDHPGTYNIVVNGFNNCGNSDSQTQEIFYSSIIDRYNNKRCSACNCGENDGMAVVSATGGMPPYQYGWSNGDNSVIADSLGSGLYVITVTDNNDCSSEGIVTVDDNQGPTILVDNVTNLGCFGGEMEQLVFQFWVGHHLMKSYGQMETKQKIFLDWLLDLMKFCNGCKWMYGDGEYHCYAARGGNCFHYNATICMWKQYRWSDGCN